MARKTNSENFWDQKKLPLSHSFLHNRSKNVFRLFALLPKVCSLPYTTVLRIVVRLFDLPPNIAEISNFNRKFEELSECFPVAD